MGEAPLYVALKHQDGSCLSPNFPDWKGGESRDLWTLQTPVVNVLTRLE